MNAENTSCFCGFLNKTVASITFNGSVDLANYIYDKTGIATVPGEGFFIDSKEMVLRIPLSIKQSDLELGFKNILTILKF